MRQDLTHIAPHLCIRNKNVTAMKLLIAIAIIAASVLFAAQD